MTPKEKAVYDAAMAVAADWECAFVIPDVTEAGYDPVRFARFMSLLKACKEAKKDG